VASAGSGSTTIQDNAVDGTDISLASEAAGDIMYFDGTDWIRLAKGTAGQVLEMNSGATAPEWDTDDSGATPGGLTTQLQYNNASTLDGASGIMVDSTETNLTVTGSIVVGSGGILSTGAVVAASFSGSGTAADSRMDLPDDDETHYFGIQANDTTTTSVNLIGPAAPFNGIPKYAVSSTTNFTMSAASAGSDYVAPSTTITIAGTANEITSSAGAQDLSASRTWTLSLPSSIDLGGKTLEIPNGNDPDVSVEGQFAWDANGDYLRMYDGTRQVALGRAIEVIHVTVIAPNDLADAQRDAFLFWSNESGMSFVVTGWKGWSGTDDTTLNIEEVDADGVSNNATVDAVELATGSGPYTGSDTTITAATIENGHMLALDFDDTDAPTYVKFTIYGYYSADVN
jgi:hypothetical protein